MDQKYDHLDDASDQVVAQVESGHSDRTRIISPLVLDEASKISAARSNLS
jgi:hypothetical protein